MLYTVSNLLWKRYTLSSFQFKVNFMDIENVWLFVFLFVCLFIQQNSSFVDWSPIVNEEEEFELESSDYSEWDLVTQSKSKEEGNSRVLWNSLFASMTLSKFCTKCHIAAKEQCAFSHSWCHTLSYYADSSPSKNSCRNGKIYLPLCLIQCGPELY